MFLASEIIARKYAKAYFRHCNNKLSDDSIVHLRNALHFCRQQKALLAYLTVPSLSNQTRANVITTLVASFDIDNDFKNLLYMLIEQRRLQLICPIIKHVINLYNKIHNIVEVTISTSHPLEPHEEQKILNFIQTKIGAQQVIPHFSINPMLISGIRIYTDTWLWENSVQQLLNTATFSVLRQVES